MGRSFEVRAVVTGHHRNVQVRPAGVVGRVWLHVPDGLDDDNEVAVDAVALAEAMAWVVEQNEQSEGV